MSDRQELANRYYELRNKKDDLAAQLKSTNESLDDVEKQLVTVMENENLTNFSDPTFGTIYLRDDIRASIEDEDQCFQWLIQAGMKDIIKQTVHAKTLAALVKDHGPEIPGVKATYMVKIGIRRGK